MKYQNLSYGMNYTVRRGEDSKRESTDIFSFLLRIIVVLAWKLSLRLTSGCTVVPWVVGVIERVPLAATEPSNWVFCPPRDEQTRDRLALIGARMVLLSFRARECRSVVRGSLLATMR
jgi:hypothetical protein